MDWKRRVFGLYQRIREEREPREAWDLWRRERDDLFRNHPQSPIPEERRDDFEGLAYFDYSPAYRVVGKVNDTEPETYGIATSGDSLYEFTRVGDVGFTLEGEEHSLELLWLEGYGGGLFLPFRDTTAGEQTYGAGRYLLDTVKGADLGGREGEIVLDFNFAYYPSCAYDARWVCPLAPPSNRLDLPVNAGERNTSP
jgi:uncharacterized protein (DUF1684 family)